jgi:hypothetical protein
MDPPSECPLSSCLLDGNVLMHITLHSQLLLKVQSLVSYNIEVNSGSVGPNV